MAELWITMWWWAVQVLEHSPTARVHTPIRFDNEWLHTAYRLLLNSLLRNSALSEISKIFVTQPADEILKCVALPNLHGTRSFLRSWLLHRWSGSAIESCCRPIQFNPYLHILLLLRLILLLSFHDFCITWGVSSFDIFQLEFVSISLMHAACSTHLIRSQL